VDFVSLAKRTLFEREKRIAIYGVRLFGNPFAWE
jgi:hypothetical protein